MTEYHFDYEVVHCPLCDSSSFSLFETTVNRGITLHNWICKRCGLVFLSPRMDVESVEKFYRSKYRVHDIERDKPIQWVVEKEETRALYQIDLLEDWIGKVPHRLLDIGASSGRLLHIATQKFNCVSVGIEPGDNYRAYASQNFKLYLNIESLIAASEKQFDVITMSHVLEHLDEPIKFLSTLRKYVLQEDGVLFIEVPNLYGHSCFEPAHLYAFTDKTLSMMLRMAGFDILKVKMHSAPRDFGWRNISILARLSSRSRIKYPRQFVFPPYIKFQRSVGLSGTRHWYGYLFSQTKKFLTMYDS